MSDYYTGPLKNLNNRYNQVGKGQAVRQLQPGITDWYDENKGTPIDEFVYWSKTGQVCGR